MRTLTDGEKCEYADCERPAEFIVYSRRLNCVIACCEAHDLTVMEQNCSEYSATCPNCGCDIPVN